MTVPDKYYLIKQYTGFDDFLLVKYKSTQTNQKMLIEHLGISKGTWENRRKQPELITLKEVFLIADFFKCDISDIVDVIHKLEK